MRVRRMSSPVWAYSPRWLAVDSLCWLALAGVSQVTWKHRQRCRQNCGRRQIWHRTTFQNKPWELLTFFRNSSATMRALALTDSFISLISLSISSMKWMTKSTSLCLYICSVWKLVIRKLISYPCSANIKKKLIIVILDSKHAMHHPPLLPQLVSSSGWRSSLLSSSWSAWTCGKESSQSHQPEVNFTNTDMLVCVNESFCKKIQSLTCLTAMLTLTELMDPSMRTFSLSFRLMTTGWSNSSLLLL